MEQVYTDGQGFVHVDLRTFKSIDRLTLENLTENIVIPNTIIYNGAQEKVGPNSEFQKTMRKCKIRGHQCEPYSQWQNRAEDSIREFKCRWKRRMINSRAPKRVWYFGMVYESKILYGISRGHEGRTSMERITGYTVGNSEWTDFELYDLCWYWDTPNDWEKSKLGRWLGVFHRIGSSLFHWILNDIGTVLASTTVQHVTRD